LKTRGVKIENKGTHRDSILSSFANLKEKLEEFENKGNQV